MKRTTYNVIDNITGEKVSFTNRCDAEIEAERRVSIHQSGYISKHIFVAPVDAYLVIDGKDYKICLR